MIEGYNIIRQNNKTESVTQMNIIIAKSYSVKTLKILFSLLYYISVYCFLFQFTLLVSFLLSLS